MSDELLGDSDNNIDGFDLEASIIRYLTERASDVYETVAFNTDSLYNRPAPPEWVSFLIGGVFSVIAIVYWVWRVLQIKKTVGGTFSTANLRIRAWISAFVDNDAPIYTIAKMCSQSFLFLGGLQYNYELTFSVMLGFFGLESCLDSFRVLLAFWDADSLSSVVVTSTALQSSIRENKEKGKEMVQIKPRNVYEDLSRDKLIVIMVFITQAVLISFVVTDVFNSETHTCVDGTPNCPVVGTLGSWGFYVLGIFMACVFLLGPKTNFGESEQDPSFWLQLLLIAKQRAKCTWYDPDLNETKSRILWRSDWRIWFRFLMSFLINGVGFHILVHALPIQVASQSSLTGVVFRAVGMMYLVDLDDTPGYMLSIVQKEDDTDNKIDEQEEDTTEEIPEKAMDDGEVAAQAEKIIAEARAKLDALQAGVVSSATTKNAKAATTGTVFLAGGVTATHAVTTGTQSGKTDEEVGANHGLAGAVSGDAGGGDSGANI